MEGVLRMIRHTESAVKKETKEISAEDQAILEEIREVNRQLRCIDRWFQMECNEDLIEAWIYQKEALHARYRYLMARARQNGISSSPFE